MEKPPHQPEYEPAPLRRTRWNRPRLVWAMISAFCALAEVAGNFATNGRISGWVDILFVLGFAVVGIMAGYMVLRPVRWLPSK